MGNFKSSHNKGASKKINAVITEAKSTHTATIIFLHGLGDTGSGWSLSLKKILPAHCKLICPNAHSIPVTLNQGMNMPAWFDIYGLDPDSRQDEAGLKKASSQLDALIAEEVAAGIPVDRIVVGGFSQGGAVALYTALTGRYSNLAGVCGLSTWLPLHKEFQNNKNMVKINKATSIIQCHGNQDPVVPIQMGMMTSQFLRMLGLDNHKFLTYPTLGHSSNDQVMKDVGKFFNDELKSDA